MVALSNGKEDKVESINADWQQTIYVATPKMSTYLLAFVVGEFDYTETYSQGGVRVSLIRLYWVS